ncbi:Hypothetical protein ORPV_907 [Orpheovirus IHUMI-LCC2]|uniref:Uncharacterized protein n=1 Tax=Orpheovirus IHUMI-LCC2 TaxID=2023057 RepID=A0A2I2L5M0_9VIRU|nr:Hypothetical protein ORPV_907 [Orpheovirus IHUMI-LCC2]SNW62811.1 Hypothetical protein ORPV_907 [Orpheovirus IHUMI-LCC2]
MLGIIAGVVVGMIGPSVGKYLVKNIVVKTAVQKLKERRWILTSKLLELVAN